MVWSAEHEPAIFTLPSVAEVLRRDTCRTRSPEPSDRRSGKRLHAYAGGIGRQGWTCHRLEEIREEAWRRQLGYDPETSGLRRAIVFCAESRAACMFHPPRKLGGDGPAHGPADRHAN